MKRQIILGLLGSTLDSHPRAERWDRWRPTLGLFRQEHLRWDRFELLADPKFEKLTREVAGDIAAVSPETKVNTHAVRSPDWWDFESVYGMLHDWATAYPFNTDEEDYHVHITTGTHVAQICLFLLCESGRIPARLVQTSPPRQVRSTEDTAGSVQIIDLNLSKYDKLAARFAAQAREDVSFLKGGIETRNAAFNALMAEIETVAARTKAPILLTGPTGAGKSQLARRICELKRTRGQVRGRYVEANCATLRGDNALSTLFGHVKGAFTGAVADRAGLLKAADGGVLFLDEIGEMGAEEQTLLLRALEEKRFMPLGSDKEVSSDFQLICGTNRDLAAEVQAGRFREDLFARINLWAFRLPGLRERHEDIEPNLEFELRRFTETEGRSARFNKEGREAFLARATHPDEPWSGNFRELRAVVTRLATLADNGRIGAADVEREFARLKALRTPMATNRQADEPLLRALLGDTGFEQLDRFDAVQLAEVVRTCRSCESLAEAGRRLFAASRSLKAKANDSDRLRKYLATFGLDWAKVAAGGA